MTPIYPSFPFIIPSSNKKIMIRPMSSCEEKILLYAKESNDIEDIFIAIKQIVKECANQLDVDKLPMFDLISLFVKLRAISATNIVHTEYIDNEDKKEYEFDIDLDKIDLIYPEKIRKIDIDGSTSIQLKYPDAALKYTLKDCIESVNSLNIKFDFFAETLDAIETFIDELPLNVINQLESFLKNQPYLYVKCEYKNANDHTRKIELKTLEDFFLLTLTKRNLNSYFHMITYLVGKQHWNLRDVEDLIPFERDIYIDLIQAETKKI